MANYLGIDVGSITTKMVVINDDDEVVARVYLRNNGEPIRAIRDAMEGTWAQLGEGASIQGVGTTGSARQLASYLVGADVVKNEITAHSVASLHLFPGAKTVIEIGGQDSKVILLRSGAVADFAMNSVCAAGTGSFLDQQAGRLGISIERLGDLALRADHSVRIAGRCTVFAETDMIHKQQMGHPLEGIVAGLCESLVKNYLNNVCRGKEILAPVVFQGGVAANRGIRKAMEAELDTPVIVPEYFDVMGAIGAARLAARAKPVRKALRSFELLKGSFSTRAFECDGCGNACEVIELLLDGRAGACWGDLCEKHRQAHKQHAHEISGG
jgi:predicted CoA-substrate-specific enzyme activase